MATHRTLPSAAVLDAGASFALDGLLGDDLLTGLPALLHLPLDAPGHPGQNVQGGAGAASRADGS
jgi:hypothetical protein